MTFVTTAFVVAGCVAMAIPILIHLLARQRRKPVQWAAMRFLIEAYRKHKRRLQIEQFILLALRCLILALFGAALARPILEATGIIDIGGARTVHLVIDNGVASSVTDHSTEPPTTALDQHREQALAIIAALNPGDHVGVITAARPARALLAPPSTDHAAVARLVRDMKLSSAASDLDGAIAAVNDVLAADDSVNTDQTLVYLLSDFRVGAARLGSPLTAVDESAVPPTLLASPPAQSSAPNVQIAAIEPGRRVLLTRGADELSQVTVHLARQGGALEADVSRVRLTGDAIEPLDPREALWAPGQSTTEVTFSARYAQVDNQAAVLTASIDDDSLAADNVRHVVVDLRERIRILLVDRRSFGFEPAVDQLTAGQWIRRALEPFDDSPLEVVETEPAALDVADMRVADVVFLPRPDLLPEPAWGLLRRFVDEGGLLVITPPSETNVHPWTAHLTDDLALPWRVALERTQHDPPLPLADEQPSAGILRLLSGDLKSLAQPILAYQTLSVLEETASGQPQARHVLTFANGEPMMVLGSPGDDAQPERAGSSDQRAEPSRGLVAYLAVAPELSWTNLPSKPLIVPLLHELVRQGLSEVSAAQQIVVGDQPILSGRRGARRLISESGEQVELGRNRQTTRPLTEAGVYDLRDDSAARVGRIAVNVEPAATDTTAQSDAAVESWLTAGGSWTWFDQAAPEAAVADAEARSPIAFQVLLAVLGLMILETILARIFSHARQEGGTIRGLLGSLRTRPSRSQTRTRQAEASIAP